MPASTRAGQPSRHPGLIAPMSTATVTSQRPTLRWALVAGTDGAHLQICRDRACTVELTSFDAAGTSAVPTVRLPPGVSLLARVRQERRHDRDHAEPHHGR